MSTAYNQACPRTCPYLQRYCSACGQELGLTAACMWSCRSPGFKRSKPSVARRQLIFLICGYTVTHQAYLHTHGRHVELSMPGFKHSKPSHATRIYTQRRPRRRAAATSPCTQGRRKPQNGPAWRGARPPGLVHPHHDLELPTPSAPHRAPCTGAHLT
eukprot:360264-Chlamydomonas_euryale.AAC.4